MAAKKKTATKKTTAAEQVKKTCSICNGTGMICDVCGDPEGACTCLENGLEEGVIHAFSDCESCEGKGTWTEPRVN